jgi:hypothetical protein
VNRAQRYFPGSRPIGNQHDIDPWPLFVDVCSTCILNRVYSCIRNIFGSDPGQRTEVFVLLLLLLLLSFEANAGMKLSPGHDHLPNSYLFVIHSLFFPSLSASHLVAIWDVGS